MLSSEVAEKRRTGWTRTLRGALLAASALGLAITAQSERASAESLNEALATAYLTNPTLRSARAELRAVDEQVPQALSGWRPQAFVVGSIGRQHIDTQVDTVIGTDEDSGGSTPKEVALEVVQPLYRGGRTQAAVRGAEETVQAQRQALLDTEQQVLLDAVTAYMDVWADQSLVKLNVQNARRLEEQLRAARDRFEVGENTRTDVAQAEARLSASISEVTASEGSLTQSRARYKEVVGVAATEVEAPGLPTELPPGLTEAVALALEQNPSLLAAVFSQKAAEAAVRERIGELLPSVNLVGSVSYDEDNGLNNDQTKRGVIEAQVSVPIYQAGFVSSLVREAKQIASQRQAQIAEAQRNIEQSMISAWEALVTAQANTESFQDEVRAQGIALEGVQEEALVGARTTLDILDAEQELLVAQVSLVESQRNTVVAAYGVLASGGLLTAQTLGLDVPIYDPTDHYQEVRNKWWGLGASEE